MIKIDPQTPATHEFETGDVMRIRLWPSGLLLLGVLLLTTGAARNPKEVDWVALHPDFAGATFVKDTSVCLSCHEDSFKTYEKTIHHQVFTANPKTPLEALDCESCHGPRSKHAESPDDTLSLKRLSPNQRSAICLQCHQGGRQHMHWNSSAHRNADVSCDSCHQVMEKRSDHALLAGADETSTCYGCHAEVRAQMQKISHHPVREGKMRCTDCHNPHGSVTPAMMRETTLNETCYRCHADKRGPFVWEHPPARESCANCHNAHGSNNRTLLTAKGGLQCLQCHQYGGHINVPRYNRTSTLYGQGCVNCHITPHGSNHPSGAKLTR